MGIFVTFAGYKDGKVRASGKAGLLQVGYALVYEDSGFSRSQHGGASDRDRGFDECRAKIFGNAVGHEAEVEVCGMVRGHRGGVVRPFYLVACQIVNAVVRRRCGADRMWRLPSAAGSAAVWRVVHGAF